MSNLVTRTLTGAAFIAIMLACLLINEYLFALLAVTLTASMLYEFYSMSMGDRHLLSRILAIIAGVSAVLLLFFNCASGMPAKYISLIAIPVFGAIASSILEKKDGSMDDYAYLLAGLLYIAAPISLSSLMVFRSGAFDAGMLLFFFVMIWSSDVGAYCIGTAFGQKENSRKLAPHISPKKSWVGFWGGMAFSIAAFLVLSALDLMDLPVVHGIVLAIIIHCGGVCGDLFESLWKRRFGVKDSGNVIPGHGGVLDRFDSSLIAVPLGAIYLSILSLF